MTNQEILNKLNEIHSLIDKHEQTKHLAKIQNKVSQLIADIYCDINYSQNKLNRIDSDLSDI